MESLSGLLKLKAMKPSKKPDKTLLWQSQALEAIKILVDGNQYKPSIFKAFKQNPRAAKIAMLDTVEIGTLHSLYFLKIYSQIKKL